MSCLESYLGRSCLGQGRGGEGYFMSRSVWAHCLGPVSEYGAGTLTK